MLKTFTIETLGCKVNQYESRQIHTFLKQLGLKPAAQSRFPDLALVNSCCITHTASSKSRQYIRKMRKNNKNGIVVLIGCLTNAPDAELKNLGENVIIIKNRSNITSQLRQIMASSNEKNTQKTEIISKNYDNEHYITTKDEPKIKTKTHTNLRNLPDLTLCQSQTRAFLKAQDGCDTYCTYCIIPFVRTDISSRPTEEILTEAENLVASGHKEIVLTGINLGAYNRPTTRRINWRNIDTDHLAELLDNLACIKNLPRIRVSSLNPLDITEKLLDVFCEHKNIMPHLHLSLQSGSDRILEKMARQYTADDYYKKVEMIKKRLEMPAITTDIIVGFPSETDDDFKQTLDFAERVGFSRIHVFSFSARKGTAAYNMKPKVEPDVIKQRANQLKSLADRLAFNYREQFVGGTARVLIETVNKRFAQGLTERYFEVKIKNAGVNLYKNDIKEVRLSKNITNHLMGKL